MSKEHIIKLDSIKGDGSLDKEKPEYDFFGTLPATSIIVSLCRWLSTESVASHLVEIQPALLGPDVYPP